MLLPNPQSPSQNPRHLRPKILAADRRRRLLAEQAASTTASMSPSQPANIVVFSPYLPATPCRFVIVEPAVPLPSLGATVLRHPLWSQHPPSSSRGANALPPNISSMAISSLPVTAACRLLHTSPIGTAILYHSVFYYSDYLCFALYIVTDVYQQGSKLPQVFQVLLSEEKNTFIRGSTIYKAQMKHG
uniref:Uncharacterized protein n=1 Tax=Oryza nivara TaxID=4536 RepID=A0A0E0HIV5_ORYNI